MPTSRIGNCPAALLSLLAIALPAFSVAAELKADSRVTAVTVYRQGTLVSREARLTLPPGEHRVVLSELPSVADPSSVRVSGSGAAGIEIRGVEVRQQFREPSLSPEYQKLQGELDDLASQQASLGDRKRATASLREFLLSLKAAAGQESSKDLLTRGFAVESWQKAFEFLSARLNGLAEEDRALEVKSKALTEKIEVVRQKLAQIASQSGIARFAATVLLFAPRGGDLTLTATYLAGNAAWAPFYDARLVPASGKVSLAWQAQVTQNTGEDWKDVSVTLATTRPSAGIDLPKLATVRLTPAIVRVARMKGGFVGIESKVLGRNEKDVLKSAAREAGPEEMEAGAPAAASAPMEVPEAEAVRREVAVTFDLPGKLDVPSDGQPHKHLIATRQIDARVEHQAVPLLVPAVFLVARLTLPGDVPLLPGMVQHFVGMDLVGRSAMTDRAPGEEFSLSFGPDDRLKAERKQILRRVNQRGKDDEIDYHFVTTIENHLGRDTTVQMKDRIPVSGDERIVVTLNETETTAGFSTDPNEPGILTWTVPVPNGGKKEIALRYRVRSPRSMMIPGLD